VAVANVTTLLTDVALLTNACFPSDVMAIPLGPLTTTILLPKVGVGVFNPTTEEIVLEAVFVIQAVVPSGVIPISGNRFDTCKAKPGIYQGDLESSW